MSIQKAGILNAVTALTSSKVASEVVEVVSTTALDQITVETLSASVEGISKTAATNVVAALELHLAISKSAKVREKKPTKVETFKAETSDEEQAGIAADVAVRRINPEGVKPRAWRSIREELNLGNPEFHKVVRLSDNWTLAVCARISQLRKENPAWAYSGKLDVLTGIDGFSMSMVDRFDEVVAEKAEKEAAQVPKAENEE